TSGAGPGDYFVQRGYIFVSVDVRGTGRSGGSGGFFSPRNARDGVELVHWVARLDGGNGVVGLTGCSYLGQTQLYTAALLGPRSPAPASPRCFGTAGTSQGSAPSSCTPRSSARSSGVHHSVLSVRACR